MNSAGDSQGPYGVPGSVLRGLRYQPMNWNLQLSTVQGLQSYRTQYFKFKQLGRRARGAQRGCGAEAVRAASALSRLREPGGTSVQVTLSRADLREVERSTIKSRGRGSKQGVYTGIYNVSYEVTWYPVRRQLWGRASISKGCKRQRGKGSLISEAGRAEVMGRPWARAQGRCGRTVSKAGSVGGGWGRGGPARVGR